MSPKFKFNCLKASSAIIFLLLFQSGRAQVSKKNPKQLGTDTYAGVDATIQKQAKALGGDLVAMLWTDTLVYKRELGAFDSRAVTPVDAASQWFTAALVMRMVDEGKISLDDKVGQYLPIFDTYGKSYITIRHCLSHFTGIQPDSKTFGKKRYGSLEDAVNAFAKKEIQSNPGTEFRYSDIGFQIAGRILEIVGKKKFDMLAKQKLFNPLGMRKSTYSNLDGSAIDPSNGAQSTADEMMRFLHMLLDGGRHNGQPFLSESSIAELKKIQTKPGAILIAPKTTEGFSYAAGSWAVETKNEEATALTGMAITGTWPMIDWCRGYAFLLFVKDGSGEKKKEQYLQLKEQIDAMHASKCN